ncbi:MAG: sensor histidine kinase [Myxococcales bacterium]
MSPRRSGLRLRMLATLTGAGLLCGAVLAVVLLLGARDEITRRHVASARAGMRSVAESAARHCGADPACFAGALATAGLSWQEGAGCGTPQRIGERLVACEEVRGGAVRQELDLAPAAFQARTLVGPVLGRVLLGMLLLVVLVAWVLDRQLVAPLGRIDEALDRVSEAASGGPLLAEGGDLLGRLAPAVNRLDLRLREERARVQSQIEELRASNRELRAARAEVARSERLASVGRLAAGVAHEVGNPMTALLGFLSILRDRLRQGKDPADYLERLAREAERIDRILRDLLGLARPPGRDLQPVDLRAAAERARGLLEAQPSWAGCALELRVPADLPRARGDDHSVVQVLLNLLVNSAKAGARRVAVEGRAESGLPVVEVIDDGRGLPPEAATRLFEPFFTTSRPGEGTGLGLALCHATMERFGGSISARQRAGGTGTSFILHFAAWT